MDMQAAEEGQYGERGACRVGSGVSSGAIMTGDFVNQEYSKPEIFNEVMVKVPWGSLHL